MSDSVKLPRERPGKMPVIPTLLTLGNGVCGLASITYAVQAASGSANDRPLFLSGVFIFVAMFFDMLDGGAARLMRQMTKFGAELDSLCDAISFGVAPAVLLSHLALGFHLRLLWVIAALFMVCTLLRLARFNVESGADEKHDSFAGLPSPAAAATVAAFAIGATGASMPETIQSLLPEGFSPSIWVRQLVPVVAVVLAGLMVSRVPYPHVARQAMKSRAQFRQLVQIVLAIAAIVALGELAAPLILCAYVASAPLAALWQKWLDLNSGDADTAPAVATKAAPPTAGTGEVPPPVKPKIVRLRLWWPARKKSKERKRA